MRTIRIIANADGSHDNIITGNYEYCPFGWAVIPNSMPIPPEFPFVNIEYEYDETAGYNVVTSITPGTIPPPTPEEQQELYKTLTVQYIRERYSENQEYQVLRVKLNGTDEGEFEAYNAYVEECKQRAYEEVYGGGE